MFFWGDPRFVLVVLAVVVVLVLIFSPAKPGGPLRRTCRNCGAAHPPFARFCRRCGQRL